MPEVIIVRKKEIALFEEKISLVSAGFIVDMDGGTHQIKQFFTQQ